MCRSALLSLALAGHRAVAVVDSELADLPLADRQLTSALTSDETLTSVKNIELVVTSGSPRGSFAKDVYAGCDRVLVIAPEINGILQKTLKRFRKYGIRTCNAGSAFVTNASDKMATAIAMRRHKVPHPPTRSLARATERWLDKINARLTPLSGQEPIWVVKPRCGAGCDGIIRITSGKIRDLRKDNGAFATSNDWIVQPWLPGRALSRVAIFDNGGNAHWLPVTEQHLSITDTVHYCGGIVQPQLAAQIQGLSELLSRAARGLGPDCRGWIGFDFLFDENNAEQPVTVIEVNPRLTTSFIGLCAAGAPGLAGAIVSATCGHAVWLPQSWQRVHFTPSSASYT